MLVSVVAEVQTNEKQPFAMYLEAIGKVFELTIP